MSSGGSESEDQNINHQLLVQGESPSQMLMGGAVEAQLYTDSNSPYHQAPKIIKDILNRFKGTNMSLDIGEFNLNDLRFKPKQGQNHFCMHVFERDQEQFYYCYQCTEEHQKIGEIVLCQKCFVPEDHKGHHFFKQISRSNLGYCDCGSYYKLKPLVKCIKHGEDRKIEINISKKQQQFFISVFKSLVDVACYLNTNSVIIQKIYNKLLEIVPQSPYYSKLTLDLIKTESQYFKDDENLKCKYILFILGINEDTSNLLIQIIGNKQLKTDLALFLIKNFKFIQSTNGYSTFISEASIGLIFDIDQLLTFSQEGKYFQEVYHRYKSCGLEYLRGIKLYENFIKYCSENKKFKFKQLEKQDYIDFILIITDQIAWEFLKMVIEIYEFPIRKKKSKGKNQKKVRVDHQANQQIKYAHQLLMRCILTITEADMKKLQNFRESLEKQNVCIEKFQRILEEIAFYAQRYFYGKKQQFQQQTPVSIVALLLLFKKSPDKELLVQNLWLSIFGGNLGLEYIVANIYEIVSDIVLSSIHFSFFQLAVTQGKMDTQKNILRSKFPKSKQKEEILKKNFIKYLSRKQIIPRKQLFQMKKGHVLNFKDSGKILITMCTYNEDDQAFYYNGAQSQQQFQGKFSYCPKESTVSNIISQIIANTYIFFGFQNNIKLNPQVKQLLQMVLSSKVIQGVLEQVYRSNVSRKNHSVQNQGYLYLFTLIMIDGFTNQYNKQIHHKLNMIKDDKKQMESYAKVQGELQAIYRLFAENYQKNQMKNQGKNNHQASNQKMISQNIAEEQQEKKKKYQDKRKKIHEKFQNKRNAALQRIKSKTLDGNLHPQDEDICITCHQKSKQGNQLVFLANIGQNNSICQAVHGENQKANTTFFTCLHTLHVNCFIAIQKTRRKMSFECPLCNSNVNCFIPRQFNNKNNYTQNIFKNVIIASMLLESKTYYIQDYKMLFFRHLVLSKGLNSLVNGVQNWQKHKMTDKSDSFVQRSLMQLHDEGNQLQKKTIQQNINRFIQSLNQCKSQSCKLVQLLIALSLKQKIVNSPKDEIIQQNLYQLYKVLKKGEYLIIKEQVQKILRYDIQINTQDVKVLQTEKKSLQFTLKQLPRDSTKFKEFQMNNPCKKNHYQKMDCYCLICGEGICDNCNDIRFQLDHCGLQAHLNLQNYTVCFKNDNMDEEIQVYYNDFCVPYHQRSDYDMEDQVYTLDILKLSSAIERFMQN